jgi:hypothetical protein
VKLREERRGITEKKCVYEGEGQEEDNMSRTRTYEGKSQEKINRNRDKTVRSNIEGGTVEDRERTGQFGEVI